MNLLPLHHPLVLQVQVHHLQVLLHQAQIQKVKVGMKADVEEEEAEAEVVHLLEKDLTEEVEVQRRRGG